MNGLCLYFTFETPKQKLFIGTFVGKKLPMNKTENKTPDGVYMEYLISLKFYCSLSAFRTYAPKSSYGEIFFISPLELVHKVLTPKMKKKWGHRLCFGENGSGKMS